MAAKGSFPSSPFWDYSLGIYRKPGVADACIALQDEFGLDVNMLLACLWFSAEGAGRLDSDQIRECVGRTRDWQDKVVKPLRTVRRYIKEQPAGLPESLRDEYRPRLQAVELDAEHVEQLLIAGVLQPIIDGRDAKSPGAGSRTQLNPGADASQNLLAYLAILGVALEQRITERLRLIVAAAFSDADLKALDGVGN
jgi:uncharacterized protein (TIGR02444 family)